MPAVIWMVAFICSRITIRTSAFANWRSRGVGPSGRRYRIGGAGISSPLGIGLIVDTDVGFDDLVAVGCLLSDLEDDGSADRTRHNLLLVTTVGGILSPHEGARFLSDLFPPGAVPAIAVGGAPARRNANDDSVWLPALRMKIRDFIRNRPSPPWNPRHVSDPEGGSAALRMVTEALGSCADGGADLLCLGPLTNLAQWARDAAPLLARKVRSVWIMGGNGPPSAHGGVPAPSPEFNFSADPGAAAAVFSSPALAGKLRIVTADASRVPSSVSAAWRKSGSGACLSAGVAADVLRSEPGAASYDPVCAFACVRPGAVRLRSFKEVRVDPSSGLVVFGGGGTGVEVDADGVLFVSDVPIAGDGGFISWVGESLGSDNINNP